MKSIKLSDKEIEEKIIRIKREFIGKPIFRNKSGYPYSLFSLTDFYPPVEPQLIEDMADLLVHFGDFRDVDLLVSEADRGGGPITHAVSVRTKIPYVLANWYPINYGIGVKVKASVGFSGKGNIYLNGVEKGQKIIIIDDLLSTGGTALALLEAVKKCKAEVMQTLFVAEKVSMGGRKLIEKNFSVPIISLVVFKSVKGYTQESHV